MACVQWKFPLDTLDGEHVSTLRHVSESGRVEWKFPLNTSHIQEKKGHITTFEVWLILILPRILKKKINLISKHKL